MRKMKKILLAVISLLPVLTYGQSMKISPKQIEAGANGNVIITRNGVNILDSLKWADISNKPNTPTLQQVTTAGATTTNPITVDIGTSVNKNGIIVSATNGGYITLKNDTTTTGDFVPTVLGWAKGGSGLRGLSLAGIGYDSYSDGAIFLQAYNSTGGNVTGGNIFRLNNYNTPYLSVSYQGVMTLNNLAGTGTRMVVANNLGTLSTQALITNNNQLTNGAGYLTSETDPIYTADKPNILSIRPLLANNTDLNTITATGIYCGSSGNTYINRPSGSVYNFVLTVKYASGGYISQEYTSYTNDRYIRYQQTAQGTWTAWKKLAFTDAIPTVNNSTLTLATSGIASGSQTFTANSSSDKTFTVNVPATNVGGSLSGNNLTLTSSTGTGATVDLSSIIPATPTLQQVTAAGGTTTNAITIDKGNIASFDPILNLKQNSGQIQFKNASSTPNVFIPAILGQSIGTTYGLYLIGQGQDSYNNGAFFLSARDAAGTGFVTGGNLFQLNNYNTPYLSVSYQGVMTLNNLAGSGDRMVVAGSGGDLKTQALITNNNQLTNGSGYITSSSLPTNYVTTNSTQTGLTGDKTWGGNQTFNGNVTLGGITGTGSNFLYVDAAGLIHATTLPGSSASIIVGGGTIQRAALTGDVTAAQNSNATTIANNAVTFSKMQNVPTASLMGRYGSGTGNVQSITLGGGLSLSGSGVLSATTVNEIDATGNFNYGFPTESYDGFDTKGGVAHNIKEVAANTNYTVQSKDYSILFNAASTSNVTCYLPEPNQTPVGRILIISNFNTTYSITLNNIEGNNQGSYTMLKGAAVYIQNNGTKWRCILSANVGGF